MIWHLKQELILVWETSCGKPDHWRCCVTRDAWKGDNFVSSDLNLLSTWQERSHFTLNLHILEVCQFSSAQYSLPYPDATEETAVCLSGSKNGARLKSPRNQRVYEFFWRAVQELPRGWRIFRRCAGIPRTALLHRLAQAPRFRCSDVGYYDMGWVDSWVKKL